MVDLNQDPTPDVNNLTDVSGTPTPLPMTPSLPLRPQEQNQTPTPMGQPQAGQPQASPTAPVTLPNGQPQPQQQQPQPSIHATIFDKILKGMTGGPVYGVDAAGNRVEIPQSRSMLGKSIVAAALTGLFTPSEYRKGPYGPVLDRGASAGAAFQAGKGVMDTARQQAMQMSEDERTRRFQTLKNNIELHSIMASTALAQFKGYSEIEAGYDAAYDTLQNYQQTKDKDDPDAILKDNLTWQEASKELTDNNGKNAMQYIAIPHGKQSHIGPNGEQETEPLYSIVANNVTMKPTAELADALATINKGWQRMYAATDGDFKIPVNMMVAALHQRSDTLQAQTLLNEYAGKIPGFDKPVTNLLSIARDNPDAARTIASWVDDHAAGTGHEKGNAGEGGGPEDLLLALAKTTGGNSLLQKAGIDPTVAADYANGIANKRISAAALAKEGGIGEKAPAAQDQVKSLIDGLSSSTDLTPDDKKRLSADIPKPDKDGIIHMTQGQVDKVTQRIDSTVTSNKGIQERNLLANGDPVQMVKTASNTIEGDVNDITKISSMRGNARVNAINAIHDEAVDRGLDTTNYSEGALDNQAKMWNDYAGGVRTKTGAQIVAVNTFLGHEAEASAANDAWSRANSPLLNKPLSWIAKNAANDPNYIRFKTSLGAPAKEYMSFLNANRAEHEADIAQMDIVLDSNSTPVQITAALKELAKTADLRLAQIGGAYISTMNRTYPGLMDADSQNTMKKFGLQSLAAPLSQSLPRGWNNHQFTDMSKVQNAKALATRFYQAAGGDRQKAQELAKFNGWILN